jgi:hypothetical protein
LPTIPAIPRPADSGTDAFIFPMTKTCTTPGCTSKHLAKGLCRKCYDLAYRKGYRERIPEERQERWRKKNRLRKRTLRKRVKILIPAMKRVGMRTDRVWSKSEKFITFLEEILAGI